MPGEGERAEGQENPEKDPFARYAKELEKKQGESKDADGPDQNTPDLVVAPPRKADESPKVEGDIEKDEFKAYAKELREKYAEETGRADWSQVGQNGAQKDEEPASEGRQVSRASDDATSQDPKLDSTVQGPQQRSDSDAGDAPPRPVDSGDNEPELHEKLRDSIDQSVTATDSNVQRDSPQDKPDPDDPEPIVPLLTETDSTKPQDSANVTERINDNQKQESANPNLREAKDRVSGDEPPRPVDMGSNKHELLETTDSMSPPAAPEDSNVDKHSQRDKPPPVDTEPITPRPTETDSTKRQDSSETDEQGPDYRKLEPVNLDPRQAKDSSAAGATRTDGKESNKLEQVEDPTNRSHVSIDSNASYDSHHNDKLLPKAKGPTSESVGTESAELSERVTRYPKQTRPTSYETASSPVETRPTKVTTSEGKGDTREPQSTSIKETHSSIIEAPVYRTGNGSLGTTMKRSSFLKAAGKEFEVGKEYVIKGRVGGIGSFETSHIEREESKLRRQISLVVGKDKNHEFTGRRCKITINSVNERKRFRVSNGERRIIEMWRPAMNSVGLAEAGRLSRDNVVELKLRSTSQSAEASKRCFVTIRPDQQSVLMRVGKLGLKRGDVVEITRRRPYDILDFVKDFNTHPRGGHENILLKSRKGVISMLVDGHRTELQNPRLSTVALQVTLSAEIGDSKRQLRFWFDGEKTNPRIDLFAIHKITASEAGLTITYMKDRTLRRTFHYSFDEFGPKRFHGIRLISEPETMNDSFHYRVSAELQADVTSRLVESSDNSRLVKGTISEKIQRHILSSMSDWIEVEDHPFDKTRKADDSRKQGPDGVWRLKSTGELCYLEFKWRLGSKDSYYQGQKEVRQFLAKYPLYKGERVSSGYLGFVEWNTKSRDLFFYLRKVDPLR